MARSSPSESSAERRSDVALQQLQGQFRYYFQAADFARLTGRPPRSPSLGMALQRLLKRRRIVAVTRRPSGYLIVPPEHAAVGAPPFTWWLDDCIKPIDSSYYVGLLSAAGHWGAASADRQDLQVVLSLAHPALTPGSIRVRFTAKHNADATPTVTVRDGMTPWRVSTRAATLLDLLRHQPAAGGLESVVRIVKEFARAIEDTDLREALDALAQVSTAQRLGFLLDRLQFSHLARLVWEWLGPAVRERALQPLEPGASAARPADSDRRWRISFDPDRMSRVLC
jgi:hypothetical protein